MSAKKTIATSCYARLKSSLAEARTKSAALSLLLADGDIDPRYRTVYEAIKAVEQVVQMYGNPCESISDFQTPKYEE